MRKLFLFMVLGTLVACGPRVQEVEPPPLIEVWVEVEPPPILEAAAVAEPPPASLVGHDGQLGEVGSTQ